MNFELCRLLNVPLSYISRARYRSHCSVQWKETTHCGNNYPCRSSSLKFTVAIVSLLCVIQAAESFSFANSFTSGSSVSSVRESQSQAVNGIVDTQGVNSTIFPSKRSRPRIPILHYSDDFVCVNKPCGMSVHSYRSQSRQRGNFVLQSLLNHRTSGALLFAFSSHAAARFHCALRHPNSTKQYIALVRGSWEHSFGNLSPVLVEKPLLVDGVLKDAATVFTPLVSLRQNSTETATSLDNSTLRRPGDCTLVLVEPKTGRTHQIRRHAHELGHPILGDTEHGDTKVNRWWREQRGLNRLALHCFCLDLSLEGITNDDHGNNDSTKADGEEQRIKIIAPFPAELSSVFRTSLDLQSFWQDAVLKDPRLNMGPFDFRGGTFGRRAKLHSTEDDHTSA